MPQASGKGIHSDGWDIREDIYSVQAFNREQVEDLEDYLDWRYPEESFDGHLRELLAHPYVARTVIENFNTPNAAKFQRVLDYLEGTQTGITMVIGRKRHWKTITACDIATELHWRTNRPVYAVGMQDEESLPEWFNTELTLDKVPQGSIVVWDELGIEAGARNATTGEQRGLPGELAISGHNKLHLIGVVQNTAIMDKAVMALVDNLLFKPLALTQSTTERGSLKAIMKHWRELLPRHKWESLFVTKDMNPWLFERPIPNYWDQSMSHAYKRLKTEAEALQLVHRLREGGATWPTVSRKLAQRGWKKSSEAWRKKVEYEGAKLASSGPV